MFFFKDLLNQVPETYDDHYVINELMTFDDDGTFSFHLLDMWPTIRAAAECFQPVPMELNTFERQLRLLIDHFIRARHHSESPKVVSDPTINSKSDH